MRLSDTGSGEPLGFTFDGKPVAAVAGDTVASALAAAGIVRVRRSTSDDDAMRGVWCGMGVCFDCLVTINGRAGQRACLAKIEGGEEVRSRSPDGTGDDPLAPLAEAPTSPHMPERSVDVLVVGAGPAGLSAALAARRHGVSVTVLDERARSGGQYYKQMAGGAAPPADRQGRAGARLIEAARTAGVELVQDAHVFGAFAADDLVALIDGTAQQFRPKRLILATGAYERPMPFPGWTLPGVMTTGAAQTLERAYDVAPGQRVVIAGNGPLNFQLAASLVAKGVEVAAVAEASPRPQRPRLAGGAPDNARRTRPHRGRARLPLAAAAGARAHPLGAYGGHRPWRRQRRGRRSGAHRCSGPTAKRVQQRPSTATRFALATASSPRPRSPAHSVAGWRSTSGISAVPPLPPMVMAGPASPMSSPSVMAHASPVPAWPWSAGALQVTPQHAGSPEAAPTKGTPYARPARRAAD